MISMKKKVCIVTAARSEYGLLKWVIDEVFHSVELELQLVVTGGHLLEEQGYTYKTIETDGYPIAAKVDIDVDASSREKVCNTMSVCLARFGEVLSSLNPDLLVVLGDRYELLPICSSALVLNIPIAHISGGDITEGAIDNNIRNAVTMMSTYHFPGTEESGNRVIRMLGTAQNVYVTGETNIDNFTRIRLLSRSFLSKDLNLDLSKKWIICTYHPETLLSFDENMNRVKSICRFFEENLKDYEVIITKSNTDFGGMAINSYFEAQSKSNKNIHLFASLGQVRYLSMLYQVEFMIGNSSSGIYESPYVGVPCINIGERQKGRFYSSNILTIEGNLVAIQQAYDTIHSEEFKQRLERNRYLYGDGHSSERIVERIKKMLI